MEYRIHRHHRRRIFGEGSVSAVSRSVSRSSLIGLGLAAALCAAAWLAPRWVRSPVQLNPELAALRAERARLQGFDDTTLDRLRADRQALARNAWTNGSIEQLERDIGSGWHWVWAEGRIQEHCVLSPRGQRLEEWPRTLALLRELSARPGLIVDSLDLIATGRAADRHFSQITIGLRFLRPDLAPTPSQLSPGQTKTGLKTKTP
jgi:hypothetical protein